MVKGSVIKGPISDQPAQELEQAGSIVMARDGEDQTVYVVVAALRHRGRRPTLTGPAKGR